MTFELAGCRAVVTGASSGIGAAIAEGLAEAGATVAIAARRTDRLSAVLGRCRVHSPDSQMFTVDLSDLAAAETFGRDLDREWGGIDLLVNNAGIPKRRMVAALSSEEVAAVMNINYLSPVRLMLTLLPGMRTRGRGAIVNIGSVAARMSPPGEAAYSASKAAITAFSEGLAVELWDEPVNVHVIHPAIIATELFSLPDNDKSFADDIEPLAPSEVFATMMAQLASGEFERYIPEWFADIASGKAANMQGFLAGSAEYFASKTQET